MAEATTADSLETGAESSTGHDDEPPEETTGVGPSGDESSGGEDLSCDGSLDGETRPCGSDIGACSEGIQTCEGGTWTQCDGTPPGEETCDDAFVDEDCDGIANEDCGCTPDDTSEVGCTQLGVCAGSAQTCDASQQWGECSIQPGVELCGTGTDEDCDGTVDEAECQDCLPGDTRPGDCPQLGDCAGNTQTCDAEGSWSACEFEPAAEVCGGGDEDCDGSANEDDVGSTWYPDADGDGFHSTSTSVQSCSQPPGFISLAASDGEDCEDLNEHVSTQCTLPPTPFVTSHTCPMSGSQITYRECPNHYDLASGPTILISGGGFYSTQNVTWSASRLNGYVRISQSCNFLEASTLHTTLTCTAHEYD